MARQGCLGRVRVNARAFISREPEGVGARVSNYHNQLRDRRVGTETRLGHGFESQSWSNGVGGGLGAVTKFGYPKIHLAVWPSSTKEHVCSNNPLVRHLRTNLPLYDVVFESSEIFHPSPENIQRMWLLCVFGMISSSGRLVMENIQCALFPVRIHPIDDSDRRCYCSVNNTIWMVGCFYAESRSFLSCINSG